MILVFGTTGQVATELRSLAPGAVFLARAEADLTDPDACAAAIRRQIPTAVINAAAYTAVDKAEGDEATAMQVNAAAPTAMARVCVALAIPLVHLSTDYVFDGAGTLPFAPDHPTAPLGAYGRSKLLGEQGVRASGGVHVILRTSWVFSAHGSNFVKTMLRLGQTRETLTVVSDQVGGPTPARAIAQACLSIVDQVTQAPDKSGTYHFAGAPDTNWADFARAIFAETGGRTNVTNIPASAYPTPAARPANSRLDCNTLETTFGISRPDWAAGLADVLKDLEIAR